MSRMTARSVITQLVREGLLYRVPGKGTFVSDPKITTNPLSYMGIREQLEKMGYEITTKLIRAENATISDKIANVLELNHRSEVFVIERVRYIKGEPLSMHTSYIPSDIGESILTQDLEGEQLCVILERDYDLKRGKVIETLESSVANQTEAKLLSVKQGYPLLLLQNTIYSPAGHPFEYSKVLFRGDKIKLKFEFNN
jgi:GntR family transcriptional regulator